MELLNRIEWLPEIITCLFKGHIWLYQTEYKVRICDRCNKTEELSRKQR